MKWLMYVIEFKNCFRSNYDELKKYRASKTAQYFALSNERFFFQLLLKNVII